MTLHVGLSTPWPRQGVLSTASPHGAGPCVRRSLAPCPGKSSLRRAQPSMGSSGRCTVRRRHCTRPATDTSAATRTRPASSGEYGGSASWTSASCAAVARSLGEAMGASFSFGDSCALGASFSCGVCGVSFSSLAASLAASLVASLAGSSSVFGTFLTSSFFTSSFFTGSAAFFSSLASLVAWCTSCFCSALACAWLRWKACACLRNALAWSSACARESSSAPACSSMSSIEDSSTCSTRPNWRSTRPSACSERCSMLSPTFSLACSEASACCS
mmetsp:Transcript_117203/g.162975  ORF Transcript_117203/g.162975 Transcript_117203/m.162975 type:complete len:274 (+) Transcript_117203:170-991(+)